MTSLIQKLVKKANKNNKIENSMYIEHNIKRGLRNDDGTGVKAILSEISDVIGYKKKETKVIPIEGKLSYRGIELKNLVNGFQNEQRYGFEETAYLLMFGDLPNNQELSEFSNSLIEKRKLPDGFVQHIILPFAGKNIMNKLQTHVTVLYDTDPNPDEISAENVIKQCMSLIAKFPTIIAHSYQSKSYKSNQKSLFIHEPNGNYSTAENFLYMIREDKNYSPLEAEILDMMLVLHADHGGGNNSTFTTHCVSSTLTDTYSAIASALGSLKGPRHGGANEKVMKMMDEIKENVDDWKNDENIIEYLCQIIKKEKGDGTGLIYGVGHPVYTISDPRSLLLKSKAEELAVSKGRLDEFQLYCKIEELVPIVFKRTNKLKANKVVNVDFYSGFVYDCMNIPRELYTPLFAMSRIVGWSAHRIEEIINGEKIIRPASVYVGPKDVKYLNSEKRN